MFGTRLQSCRVANGDIRGAHLAGGGVPAAGAMAPLQHGGGACEVAVAFQDARMVRTARREPVVASCGALLHHGGVVAIDRRGAFHLS